jgi:hypothetical protein
MAHVAVIPDRRLVSGFAFQRLEFFERIELRWGHPRRGRLTFSVSEISA